MPQPNGDIHELAEALTYDAEGFVLDYPGSATRLE